MFDKLEKWLARPQIGDEDEWILRVQDDGIGMPEGFDHQNIGSLGSQLVNNLAIQLQGSMTIQEGGSANIEIRFSVSEIKSEAV